MELKDSGAREEMVTGSVRDSRDGKGRFDLVMLGWPRILRALARHMEAGYVKYGKDPETGEPEQPWRNNWTRGQQLGRYLDSACRHLNKWLAGEDDENHFVACLWNLLCLAETQLRIKAGLLPAELDDLGGLQVVTYD